MSYVRIFGEPLLCKFDAIGGSGEPDEKEGIGGLCEKFALRFLRIFVHSVTHNVKRNDCIFQKFVVSVVPVRQDKNFKKLDEFSLFYAHLLRQLLEHAWQLSLAESFKRLLH